MDYRVFLKKQILFLLVALILPFSGIGETFTVVIDPGHGGHDAGAVGTTAKEKDINLAVALKLGKLIKDNCKDVKVVYTRDNDVFIPLQSRADIANKASGDLFISIHTNSVDKKSKNYRTVAGASVYTLGFRRSEENLAVAMRENSVIKLEADYSTVYEGFDPTSSESYIIFEMSRDKHMEQSISAASVMQNELVSSAGRKDHGVRQANFWVLFKTSMPAILVELDFICNPTSEKFMSSPEGQNKLAQALYSGFCTYKKSDDLKKASLSSDPKQTGSKNRKEQKAGEKNQVKNEKTASKQTKDTEPEQKKNEIAKKEPPQQSKKTNSDAVVYKIQFLLSSKKLPSGSSQFKGLKNVDYYEDGGSYKYTSGEYSSQDEAQKALPSVKKLFSDAFIIKMQGGKRVK